MRRMAVLAAFFCSLFFVRAASSQTTPDPAVRNEARTFFESGVAHFDRAEWSAALADFLRSRALYPTRAATQNAAVCFRKEGRLDESLDMFDALLREFPDLAPADRAFVEKQSGELRQSIGAVEIASAEPGASIVIDGRARGSYPTRAPLRVGAGSHSIRIYKEGFGPFEARVDVAGRQTVLVEARLAALVQSGRLSVTEVGNRALEVLVDNVVVGTTPWQASIAVGDHAVLLRGEKDLGTPPTRATVRLGQTTALALSAEVLDSTLRVNPQPAGARVSIDAVVVGAGVWEGPLRAGSHRVEVVADGYLLERRDVTLVHKQRTAIEVSLERDASSPLWRESHPARVFVDVEAGPVVGLVFGGDVRSGCTGACRAAVPFGFTALARVGYELSNGIALGLDAGYFLLSAGTSHRETSVVPRGLAPDAGVVDDTLGIRGIRFGASAGYRSGEEWPLTARLGAGLFLGTAIDARHGTFTTGGGLGYPVDIEESPAASYVYLAPEVRLAHRFPSRFELSAGVGAFVAAATSRPRWANEQPVVAAPRGQQGDGLATFGTQTLAGSVVLAIVPSVGARYAF